MKKSPKLFKKAGAALKALALCPALFAAAARADFQESGRGGEMAAGLSIETGLQPAGKITSGNYSGSGFFLEGGVFVTAFHVMERLLKAAPLDRALILHAGRQYAVRGIKRLSAPLDLALLEAEGYKGPALKLSRFSESFPESSQETPFKDLCAGGAYIMGFPLFGAGLQKVKAVCGAAGRDYVVSGRVFMDGFSGAPVLSGQGQVLGAVSYGFSNIVFITQSGDIKKLAMSQAAADSPAARPLTDQEARRQVEMEAENLEKLADSGHALAQYRLSLRLRQRDLAAAARYLALSAERGFIPAQSDLGLALFQGRGMDKDKERAVYWLRQAAERGFPPARFNLAIFFGQEGDFQNLEKSFYWHRLAAEQGFAPAMFHLGSMMREGRRADREGERAAYWIRLSAERGFAPAQMLLAEMLKTGDGLPQDDKEAFYWLRQLAEQRRGRMGARRFSPP